MNFLFSGCESLSSLDLSNFVIKNGTFYDYIFNGCTDLKYLNLKSANLSTNLIELVNNLLVTNILICLDNELNLIHKR